MPKFFSNLLPVLALISSFVFLYDVLNFCWINHNIQKKPASAVGHVVEIQKVSLNKRSNYFPIIEFTSIKNEFFRFRPQFEEYAKRDDIKVGETRRVVYYIDDPHYARVENANEKDNILLGLFAFMIMLVVSILLYFSRNFFTNLVGTFVARMKSH
jgi:hypothetical protein